MSGFDADTSTADSDAPRGIGDGTKSPISRIEIYSYDLTYIHGEYVMSAGRVIRRLQSTVVKVTTADGIVGYGETCPLGANYLPAHSAGARAALVEIGPHLIGLDAANPAAVGSVADRVLRGHGYAKSALDVACWDVLGKASARPVCDLIGGRQHERFPLYVAIPLGTAQQMRDHVVRLQDAGVHRFQLKLGGDPADDARRARAVIEVAGPDDVVVGDANGGWTLRDAIVAARLMDALPGLILEQPCKSYEECLRVRQHSSVPMILDEVITDLSTLLRAWEDRAMEGFNLKISRVGGLTKARMVRDVGAALGMTVNIEDTWGGDLTTAAVSHLAASTSPEVVTMVSFMNDWTNEHVAGHQPRSDHGWGQAPDDPGLGVSVDETVLGAPVATFA